MRATALVLALGSGAIAVFLVAALVAGDPDQPPTTRMELADPARTHDPVFAGEKLPAGYRQLLPRDAIRPIYAPTFVPARDASWRGATLVIGFERGGTARAYPVAYLDRREMVIDEVDGIPILVSWCPLCGTAMVHRREVNGREIVLGNQGALFGNAMTWWDHETGSVWSQPLGEAILGPMRGATLELLPSQLTTWEAWREAHPDTLALDAPGGSPGIGLTDTVVVVEFGPEVAAYPLDAVREAGVVNDLVADVPVAVLVDPDDPDRWAVFSRAVGDRDLIFEISGSRVVDRGTGSEWDPVRGVATAGPLEGTVLDRLPSLTSFPEDVSTFWPAARFWPPSRVLDG